MIRSLQHKFFRRLMLASSLLFATSAHASWLDQGMELLKSVQQTDSDSKSTTSTSAGALTNDEIQKAFKEALNKGTETAVKQLGAKDGFNADPQIHIPLPKTLQKVQSTLTQFGMGEYMDDVEIRLNRAAEAATPEAKALFIDAIKGMTFDDVKKIYNGSEDSATQYLKEKTSAKIKTKMEPIIEKSLNEVGAISAYDKAIAKYKKVPFVPDVKADLQEHVINEGIEGIFYYIAQEEAAIRKDPVKQSTELLKKVFGN